VNCAYCDNPCTPTREHVIPDWYGKTPGESSTFNARSPMKQLSGDILVKDVCPNCNNIVLGALDAYAKELYDRFFASPVYQGETVDFEYDADRLVRWLLKVSYNSGRAQNADVRILRDYRKVMLGEEPITGHVRCWVSLTTPTYFDEKNTPRPAMPHERGDENVEEPRWFRITQFRMADHRGDYLVQRLVLINSFRFTILVDRKDSDLPSIEMDTWIAAFSKEYPEAVPILPVGRLAVGTNHDHYASSVSPLFSHFPSRFLDDPNPLVAQVAAREIGGVGLIITPDMIHTSDKSDIVKTLRGMVGTREAAFGFRQIVDLQVTGYEKDPRNLWMIPKVRDYFRDLFIQCPFIMLLSHPCGSLLKVFAACWVYEDGMTRASYERRMGEFYDIAFLGLNDVAHRLAISDETNREICFAVAETLTGEKYPYRGE